MAEIMTYPDRPRDELQVAAGVSVQRAVQRAELPVVRPGAGQVEARRELRPQLLPAISLERARDRQLVWSGAPGWEIVAVLNASELVGLDVRMTVDDPNAVPMPLSELQVIPWPGGVTRLYLSHPAYPGRVLQLGLWPAGALPVLSRPGVVQLEGQPNSARRFELDLTQQHDGLSLAQALGMETLTGVQLVVLRLGGGPWSMQFEPAWQYPDVWYSSDLNEGAEFSGAFSDVRFTNIATAGADPAIFAVGLRV